MHDIEFEKSLQKSIDELEITMHPQRDLWSGIDMALVQSSTQRLTQSSWIEQLKNLFSVPQLGIITAVLIIGFFSFNSLQEVQKAQLGSELVATLSQQHEVQKNNLLASFEKDSALTVNWQQQLAELDLAAQAVKKALEHEPNNMELLKMLQQVHQQQIDLIEAVHAPKWTQA